MEKNFKTNVRELYFNCDVDWFSVYMLTGVPHYHIGLGVGVTEQWSPPLPNLCFSPCHSAPTTKQTQMTLTASFPAIPHHEIHITVQLGSERVPCSSRLHSFAYTCYLTRMQFPTSSFPSEIFRLHTVYCAYSVMFNSLRPMDYSLPGSSVRGILQARILECIAISFSRGSSWPRTQIWVSCIAGRFFTDWATKEALSRLHLNRITSQRFYIQILSSWD